MKEKIREELEEKSLKPLVIKIAIPATQNGFKIDGEAVELEMQFACEGEGTRLTSLVLNHVPIGQHVMTPEELDTIQSSVQMALASPELLDPELFREEVVVLNDLVFEVNQQLNKVGRLLDKGLRDTKPKTGFDRVRACSMSTNASNRLQLDHGVCWSTHLVFPRPPELNHDAAAKLNSAYGRLNDLGSLLIEHRRLAFGACAAYRSYSHP